MGAAALDELAVNPGRQRENDEEQAEPQRPFAIIQRDEAEQPHGGGEHREAHGDLEPLHPGAGLREELQPCRLPAQDDVRGGEPQAHDHEHQHNDAGGLREGESEGRAEEGGGAGRGQDGGQHAVEERARGAVFRRQSPRRTHDPRRPD